MKRSRFTSRSKPLARGPMKRTTTLAARGPAKPGERRAETEARRLVYDRSGGICEVDNCGPATEWHHIKPRSQGGRWVAPNGLHLARPCHLVITATRTRWYDLGWLMKRDDVPGTVPVWTDRDGWVLLTADGGREFDHTLLDPWPEVHPLSCNTMRTEHGWCTCSYRGTR